MNAGAVAAATYDNATYAAETNRVADEMAEVITGVVGVDDGDLQDNVFVEKGTETRPTVVGVRGRHPSTDGRPIAPQLSVAYLNNFGANGRPGTQFMEAAAAYAATQGLERG